MMHPITPKTEEKIKTGRFPNLVAKAEIKGLADEPKQMR
jgi:hypothetical protein